MRYSRFRRCLKPFLPNVRLRRKYLGSSWPNGCLGKRLTLGMPATYRINIQGSIDKRWGDRLGDVLITTRGGEGDAPVTILVGRMRDQAELMGVLNSLYELHLPLLSVEILDNE
jgi:hypothetical protein